MKWFASITAAALLAGSASASPIAQSEPASYGGDSSTLENTQTTYNLKVKAADPKLDGKYLSVSDSNVGIYGGQERLAVSADAETGTTGPLYTTGGSDQALAVEGTGGIFNLKDLEDPEAAQPSSEGATLSWDDFVLDSESGEVGWRASGDAAPATQDESKWVVFPGAKSGEWEVRWYSPDPDTFSTQNYLPISIIYEEVGSETEPEPADGQEDTSEAGNV